MMCCLQFCLLLTERYRAFTFHLSGIWDWVLHQTLTSLNYSYQISNLQHSYMMSLDTKFQFHHFLRFEEWGIHFQNDVFRKLFLICSLYYGIFDWAIDFLEHITLVRLVIFLEPLAHPILLFSPVYSYLYCVISSFFLMASLKKGSLL